MRRLCRKQESRRCEVVCIEVDDILHRFVMGWPVSAIPFRSGYVRTVRLIRFRYFVENG